LRGFFLFSFLSAWLCCCARYEPWCWAYSSYWLPEIVACPTPSPTDCVLVFVARQKSSEKNKLSR
jgi:hypothetical protein